MRIGTWNLDARWTTVHARAIADADCDVWLLTELPPSARPAGFHRHLGHARMARGQCYAAVLSRSEFETLPDPHPAGAAVLLDGITYCSSVLPWAAPDDPDVWGTGSQGERTAAAVAALVRTLPAGRTVWGGDFNHALVGDVRHGGSREGRAAIVAGLEALSLSAPTAGLPHRLGGLRSIDHIAVPTNLRVIVAEVIAAPRLSDHDAYVVTTETVRPIF